MIAQRIGLYIDCGSPVCPLTLCRRAFYRFGPNILKDGLPGTERALPAKHGVLADADRHCPIGKFRVTGTVDRRNCKELTACYFRCTSS